VLEQMNMRFLIRASVIQRHLFRRNAQLSVMETYNDETRYMTRQLDVNVSSTTFSAATLNFFEYRHSKSLPFSFRCPMEVEMVAFELAASIDHVIMSSPFSVRLW
jgi:hypothetical protein